MQMVVSDAGGRPLFSTSAYDLDLQYGGDKCDFEVALGRVLEPGWRISCDGTPFGGIVDRRCPRHEESGDSITYKGRTAQGVLAAKVVMPPAGSTHLIVSGDANAVIADVVSRVGLGSYFKVPAAPAGHALKGYRFHRYIDAWTGLRMAMASVGCRLRLCHTASGCEMSAVPADTFGDAPSERVYFALEQECRPVNHLVGLGKGVGLERAVSHWYADERGVVSQAQTLFGVDEVALAYDLSSEEADTLPAKTRAKLVEYQEASEADISLPAGASLDVGDVVRIVSSRFGIAASVQVVGVVAKVSDGVADVSYQFGMPDWPKEEE